ncbi:NAD-dependent epimerase/dehydratase family protein [Lachnoclostridium sp. Marseille-P6806]|uniref:NAD-dependent epimerase/dehydratase family protein n=1 Tax=Lachnoclostridium sp. Marseille-P6806 TaxID=2364793 RepID=UPI001030F44D|nr:NAD-dependent epimerase/dehydratase family protein [Lachnoclostridium sp. Marseille-P6806]
MRRALFIGGTGTISTAIVRRLTAEYTDWEVYVLNRGNRSGALPEGVHRITADINDEEKVREELDKLPFRVFDTVCEWIGFVPEQVERDFRLFRGRTRQYMYTSSASAYHKPPRSCRITEGTALANPYWEYSRNKIACEEFLMKQYRETGFPVTIIRPSHTYDDRSIPVGVHGKQGPWQVIRRMMEEKPVIIPGDGSSLWTVTFHTDFAVGYTGLMGNPHAIGEAFQITGEETLTWNQVHEEIAAAAGVPLHAVHVSSEFLSLAGDRKYGYDFNGSLIGDKAVSVLFDNSKLKRVVPEMCTRVPFAQGVRIALKNILEHPELQREDPEFDVFTESVLAAREAALEALNR